MLNTIVRILFSCIRVCNPNSFYRINIIGLRYFEVYKRSGFDIARISITLMNSPHIIIGIIIGRARRVAHFTYETSVITS